MVPRGENPSYPHHAYAITNENNNVAGVNTIEALKEAYREMVSSPNFVHLIRDNKK